MPKPSVVGKTSRTTSIATESPNSTLKFSKCDIPGHHVCRLTRFNLRNALCSAPSPPDTPVRTDNVIENLFCWNANLPAPGATKPRALHDLAGDHEHESDSLMDDAWPRLIEVVEYPCKSSEADADDKKPRGSLRSRYFVERSVVNGYDQFGEIDWKKENSGIKSLSLQVCIILVCEARGGKQWEVNVLG